MTTLRAIPVGNPFAARPWQQLYGERAASPASVVDVLSAFRRVTQRASATHAVNYFDAGYTYAWLDERSDALAGWLAQDCHVARRSHVAILLQNVPDFIVAVLAIWKLGAVPMPLKPMYKQQELGRLFADSGPCTVICHSGAGAVVRAGVAAAGLPPSTPIITVCPRAHQRRDDVRVIPARPPIECSPVVARFGWTDVCPRFFVPQRPLCTSANDAKGSRDDPRMASRRAAHAMRGSDLPGSRA